MPNWCNNNMVLHGPEDQVRSILEAVRPVEGKSDELTFTKFMPQPRDEQGELIGSVDWQYDTWGTKWGDCDTDICSEEYSDGTGTASVGYTTAWGPMSGLVKEISRQHPGVTIDIEYEEPGMSFFGIEQYLGGELVHEQHHDYNFESGTITLPDGWTASFDTEWDDENQDPSGTLNDAVYAGLEHMWTTMGLGMGRRKMTGQ